MDPFREDLLADLGGLASRPPEARLVSTVTGQIVEAEALDAEYWWRNMRNPVRFTDGSRPPDRRRASHLSRDRPAGHSSILPDGRPARGRGARARACESLHESKMTTIRFPRLRHIAMWPDMIGRHRASFDGPADPRGLPLYPWNRERFWFAVTTEAADLVNPPFDHPLLGFRQRGAPPSWLNHLDEQVLPWIADHAIEGVAVLTGGRGSGDGARRRAVAMAGCAGARGVRCRAAPPDAVRQGSDARAAHRRSNPMRATGSLQADRACRTSPWRSTRSGASPLQPTRRRIISWSRRHIGAAPDRRREHSIASRNSRGLITAARFRTVTHVEIAGPHSAIAHLDPSPVCDDLGSYLLHPALLDGALQGLFGLLADRQHQLQGVGFLPWRFGRVRFLAPFGRLPDAPGCGSPGSASDRCPPISPFSTMQATSLRNSPIAGSGASS